MNTSTIKTLGIAALFAIGTLHAQPIVINDDEVLDENFSFGDTGHVIVGLGQDESGSLTITSGADVTLKILDLGEGDPTATGYLEITGANSQIRSIADVVGESLFQIGVDGTGEVLAKEL